MSVPTILIACPVQNRAWILDEYLKHFYALSYPKERIGIYWIVNNSTDDSLKILKDFKKQHSSEYFMINIHEVNNSKFAPDNRDKVTRRTSTYHWLAQLRNYILKYCVSNKYDYVLSSDSDILLEHDTIVRLLLDDQPIVSCLVYNGYMQSSEPAYRYPNVLRWSDTESKYIHVVTNRTIHWDRNPIGTLVKCDFTGACILIRNDVCKVARYAHFPRGEDEPFCRSALLKGFPIYCDISLFNHHIMSEQLLKEHLSKRNTDVQL